MRWSSKTLDCELLAKIWIQNSPLSSTVKQCRLFIGERALNSFTWPTWQMFGRLKENPQLTITPPLITPLPTRPPVSGEYGRLDSPWRVRSHLKTPGQPKAGTVTITRPQSLWALTHREHNKRSLWRRDPTGNAVGLRWRGIQVIINDQWWAKERKQTASSTKLVLLGLKWASAVQWMSWKVWQIPLTNFWGTCVLNWKLKCTLAWNKSNGEKKILTVSVGCDQYKKLNH